jgi:hypothetical protein
MNVLYVGSGKSASLVHKLDLSKYTIVCANNAWRLFTDSHFHYWIHSGDFPSENFPPVKNYDHEISTKHYSKSADNIAKNLKMNCKSPQHHLGYSVCFMGLYWIIDSLKPTKISLLGFDHDYNSEKLNKWEEHKRPNIQNKFNNKPKDQSIEQWSNQFFDGMQTDFFYGHGTPDPMRLGTKHLQDKFSFAMENCKKLNIQLVNLSPVQSIINTLPKEAI